MLETITAMAVGGPRSGEIISTVLTNTLVLTDPIVPQLVPMTKDLADTCTTSPATFRNKTYKVAQFCNYGDGVPEYTYYLIPKEKAGPNEGRYILETLGRVYADSHAEPT